VKQERILGTGDFVERVLSESRDPLRHRSSPVEQSRRVEIILKGECQLRKISFEELRMPVRQGRIPWVRSEIAERFVKELGVSLARWHDYWASPRLRFLRFCME